MNRSSIRKEVLRINRKYEELFYPSVLRTLTTKAKAVAEALQSGGFNAASAMLSVDFSNGPLTERIHRLYKIVGVRYANRTYAGLRKQAQVKRFVFNDEWANEVMNYLRKFLLEKITFEVNNTTRNQLLKVLEQGIEEGLSVDEMVTRLKELPFLRYQAARIVRTEIKRASEVGSKIGSDSFEYEQDKEWIAITDNRVRGRNPEDHADHLHMNGQVVDANAKFKDSRSGAELMFPGDPEAGAGNTINCRCTTAYVAKRDERGRLIPKKTRSRVSVIMPGDFNRQRQIVTI